MPTLTVLCGLPGSGKSTFATECCNANPKLVVVSTDSIRKELYGDESVQGNHSVVFATAYKRTQSALAKGFDVVFDATSLYKRSWAFLESALQGIGHESACVVFDVPIEECKRRNLARDRVVPEEVIDAMSSRAGIKAGYGELFNEALRFFGSNVELASERRRAKDREEEM